MPRTIDHEFDVVVLDRGDRAVAFVEVKARPITNWREILDSRVARLSDAVDFIIAVDTHEILIYRAEEGRLGECLASLKSRKILAHYDPEFSNRRVFHPYLITLAEAWLRDLAYHRKTDNPPEAETMDRIGLLGRLEGGTTVSAGES